MKSKRASTKQVVGRFRLGWRWVEVRIDTSHCNGSGWFIPDEPEPQITIIEVGTKGPYSRAVATLLHEVIETALSELELRFTPCGALGSSAEQCVFMFTHTQFSEITDRAGHFMASVLPRFRKTFLAHKPKGGAR